jgi:protein SCO1/2
MDKIRPLILIVMLGAFLTSSAFFYQYLGSLRPKALPVLGEVKDFDLQGIDRPVKLADLKGKVWIADFMFTTCGGICPMMTKNLAQVQRLYDGAPDVRMVSISVNPDNDTPEVLKAYAKKYNADTTRWFFLTGPAEDIKKVAVESFKLGDIKEPIFHSSYFTLVDRQARIRGYYDGTEPDQVKKLSDDIARLKKEP